MCFCFDKVQHASGTLCMRGGDYRFGFTFRSQKPPLNNSCNKPSCNKACYVKNERSHPLARKKHELLSWSRAWILVQPLYTCVLDLCTRVAPPRKWAATWAAFFGKGSLANMRVDIQAYSAAFISINCSLCHRLNAVTGAAIFSELSVEKEKE